MDAAEEACATEAARGRELEQQTAQLSEQVARDAVDVGAIGAEISELEQRGEQGGQRELELEVEKRELSSQVSARDLVSEHVTSCFGT